MKKSFEIIEIDPYLSPYENDIKLRMERYEAAKKRLVGDNGSLAEFANGHLHFGFHRQHDGWIFREWAPHAQSVSLIGEFNNWDRLSHKLNRVDNGVWEIFIPGADSIKHGSRVKLDVRANGQSFDRIPSYCRRIVQDPFTNAFDGQVWCPEEDFRWTDGNFSSPKDDSPFIYECHVGMSGEEGKITSFNEFTANVLPRVKKLGYNVIQMMAIMEHPYYASFGYQVTNFFAVSSRFGTPDDLKNLVNTAHSMGISVYLDLIHSHAAPNALEGLSFFDGTDYQYFHEGAKGNHPAWGTKLFNYDKNEVLHFLLSNLKYWMDEYHFDGFRFDGVTSMLYHDHGLGEAFDNYKKYFSMNTHTEAITYLQLASRLCKEVNPNCVLIAEDMSGLPGMCVPIEAGGVGFDYRLGMGVPDFWIKTLKTKTDEQWSMGHMWHELNQRRPKEKVIGYCESHDQALVGDKTIMFWLADKEMYWKMGNRDESLVIDRALALHKMIRLVTCGCAGDGYLNFMGNEFGHPEWIDFPREGNGWSYHYARRLWSVCEDGNLKYKGLNNFDRDMVHLMRGSKLLKNVSKQVYCHDENKLIAFTKGDYVFVFNFHSNNKQSFQVNVGMDGVFETVIDTNWAEYSGWADNEISFYKTANQTLSVEIEKRTGIVLKLQK